jgi:heparin binding hemagglutinin HbhA
MTATETVKQYGETVLSLYRTPVLVAIGAGDLAVERTRTAVDQFRSRAEALPGEAQVQADLAVKQARTRAGEAVDRTRTTAQQFVSVLRPEAVRGLVETARTQALSTVEELAGRGAEVVEEIRRQPGVRRVVRRAEDAVDTVEARTEEALQGTAEAVAEASNEVTSVAQKTAAKATKVASKAEKRVAEAAEETKEVVDSVEKPAEGSSRKATTAARGTTPAKASARVTRARAAKPADPTAVPTKRTR